jgi:hypothetical protein
VFILVAARLSTHVHELRVSVGAAWARSSQHCDPEDSPAEDRQMAMRLTSLSAVRSFASSALHPDLGDFVKTSTFHLSAYHSTFSIASRQERTGRS